MTLAAFSTAVDHCAAAGRALAEAVAGGDLHGIEEATQRLSLSVLDIQRALPGALPALQAAPEEIRLSWQARLADALQPLKIGAELSTIQTASVAARLAALARISGADLSYSSSGRFSR
ncbi:MAG: hypothetical protein QHC78_00295 [Pigmentiphaga sp.]|uniref:hypothetical protein n=1 Tax=Pigmentiphaga sp. TaxID=1977564 RepID=UPI0029A4317C|nr:hypothetical protein [Pigmentiphaga sp.]MDX3904117.1 hypothetical protein [Pigmentiphaga sp.]